MAKKSIPLKALVQDLKSGMDDAALMEKHNLTAEQLDTVFRKAVEKEGITQKQLDTLRQGGKRPAGKTPLKELKKPEYQQIEEVALSNPSPPPVKPAAPHAVKSGGPEAVSANTQPLDEAPPIESRRSPIRRIILLLLLLAFIAGFIVMVKFLPWWASVIILIATGGLTWLLAKYFLKRLFMTPFKMKGKVLAGADVTVNSVTPAGPPDLDDEDQEVVSEHRSLNWCYVDATITPKDKPGSFTHWEPGELALVGMDAKPEEIEDEEREVAQIHDYRIFSDGDFREDEVYKHPGSQRIQFHVGVKPGESLLQFRYYFELFGKVVIQIK